MELRLELRGMDGLSERLAPDGLLAAARGAMASELFAVAQDARALCPVQTGTLRDSIAVRVQEDGAAGEVAASAPYAVCVELGTAGRAAHPFLYPAFAARRTGMTEQIARAVIRRAESGGEG